MILFWNVRGINDPKKQKNLKAVLRKFQGSIICLLETHVKKDHFLSIFGNLLPGWTILANYEDAYLGRIWIAHDESIRMEVFSQSAQVVHCHSYSLKLKKYFFLSVVYAYNTTAARK